MKKNFHKQIGLISLILVSSSFVTSVRNLPTIAETGFSMIFFGLIAAIGFFIPTALVSAELSAAWPKRGGIYAWVADAFGPKFGFLVSFLLWMYVMTSLIAVLYFIGATFAYVFAPSLAENRAYLILMSLLIIWGFTLFHLKGIKISTKISMTGFVCGIALPAALIIVLGLVYVFLGHPIQMDFSLTKANFFPDFSNICTLVLLISFIRAFSGIEAVAVLADHVKNPSRNFPVSMLFVVIIALTINILGSMSVAIVIPQEQISLTAGLMEAFKIFFSKFHLELLLPCVAILITIGQMGSFSSWLIGPSTSIVAAAENGDLPPFFKKLNKNKVAANLLIFQALLIALLSISFLLLKSINIAFWISVAISMLAYGTVYIILFLAAIKLRYKYPDTARPFKIWGKKNLGMWITCAIGIAMMLFTLLIAFFPPAQLPTGDMASYETIIIVSLLLFFLIPFLIQKYKKPSWNSHNKP